MEIRPAGAELFDADRRMGGQIDRKTDMTKLIVTFRNFANAHIKEFSVITKIIAK